MQLATDIDALEAEVAYYKSAKKDIEAEIKQLESRIWTAENTEEQLQQQVKDVQRTYDQLATKMEEVRITKVQKTSDVKFMAQAVPPTEPLGPNKKLNLAIALVLGTMIGVFAAFVVEFWSKEQKGVVSS